MKEGDGGTHAVYNKSHDFYKIRFSNETFYISCLDINHDHLKKKEDICKHILILSTTKLERNYSV